MRYLNLLLTFDIRRNAPYVFDRLNCRQRNCAML